MDEQALSGGNMGGAVRVGATVRKPTKRQSATIQRLLTHVRAQGVTWVPEPLGTDEQGRDVWSFIAGEVVHDQPTWLWSTDILTTVARRLRQWHDATASFERHRDDVWWWPGKLPADVICHVDCATGKRARSSAATASFSAYTQRGSRAAHAAPPTKCRFATPKLRLLNSCA